MKRVGFQEASQTTIKRRIGRSAQAVQRRGAFRFGGTGQ